MNRRYRLRAVVAHYGPRPTSGHYRCFIHTTDNQGFRCYNDGSPAADLGQELPEEALNGSRLLVYESLEASCASTGCDSAIVVPPLSPALAAPAFPKTSIAALEPEAGENAQH